jgi:hypothetical protein
MKMALSLVVVAATAVGVAAEPWERGVFRWEASAPLIDVGPGKDADDPHVAVKDPTVVFHEGRWHVITTLRKRSGQVMMEQMSFTDWSEANAAPRQTIRFQEQYHCAPQVFWFTPHRKWYLIYQASLARVRPAGAEARLPLPEDFVLVPCFSTAEALGDAKAWSQPQPMIEVPREGAARPRWIDFWVICDAEKAHLFYTSDDGHFWRRETAKAAFPFGWSPAELVLQDTKNELFEASHTYKLAGRQEYLTIIEAIGDRCRYYKAWLADRLEGPWRPLAATREQPFAAAWQVKQDPAWTTSISHGELLRSGSDETLEVDPRNLRFLFQGVDEAGYTQKYGSIPWRLGLLELTP